MLTGDKQETALNIGNAVKLLSTNMQLLYCNFKSIEEAREVL